MKLTKSQKNTVIRLGITAALALVALILTSKVQVLDLHIARIALFAPSYLIAGFPTLKKAFSNMIRGQLFDENFLMAIASLSAMALGECFEAVAIVFFSGVGELFEESALERVRSSVASLAKLCPDSATVLSDGALVTLPTDEIEVGDICVVKAGERIATDGVIIAGSASIDCSALTGESKPVDLFEGDEVSSGCINLDGTLNIRVTRRAEHSGAARIIEMIEESALKKTKSEKFITKFALRYTPVVVIAAVLMAVLLPVFSLAQWRESVYIALCFLVVSCPCALVISVPLTFFGAIGGGSKSGILFKSNKALESMAGLTTVLFDKTGTLTKGDLSVSRVISSEGVTHSELIEYALAAEESSAHPISHALVSYAKKMGSMLRDEPKNVHEERGMGRECIYDGKLILAGNQRLLEKHSVVMPDDIKNLENHGETLIYIAADGAFLGLITLSDSPKSDASQAISTLKSKGIKTVMLTGDNGECARAVAGELGISDYESGLLPEDKVRYTEEYMAKNKKGETLAFVGDGINDAPSLACADIGIAMGTIGSDIAIETADIVVVNDSPMAIAKAHALATRAVRIAKQNIIFSLVIKFAVLLLIAFGHLGMAAAVFADVGVSIIAILNAMRTLKK